MDVPSHERLSGASLLEPRGATGATTIAAMDGREDCARHGVPAKPVVGLFVAWALSRGLLDESRFPEHRALLDRVKARAAQGSAVVDAATPRALARPSRAEDEVRRVAASLFLGDEDVSLVGIWIDLFGERTNAHGHSEPVLDEDGWDAVDRATGLLDQRFPGGFTKS